MRHINFIAKADHFAELASRAAYNAAISPPGYDRDQWEERAARYDANESAYRMAARKAA